MPLDPVGSAAVKAGKQWRSTHPGMSSTFAEAAIRNSFRIDYGDERTQPSLFNTYREYFLHEVDRET